MFFDLNLRYTYLRMAEFSKGVRKFWQNVAKNEFGEIDGQPPEVLMVYSEKTGFRLSGRPAREVHHVIPESLAEMEGQLANEQVGLPLSAISHRGRGGNLPFCPGESMHPDMAKAREKYRKGDKEAFEKARQKRADEARLGKRPSGFDPNVALYYEELMRTAAVKYIAETGARKPQSSKERPKKRHWSDGLFD